MGDYSTSVFSEIDREFIRNLLDKGERMDGRALDEYRPTEIELGVVPAKAEGSALVRMGNTSVVAGVKVLVGTPYPDNPNDGVVMVTAELPPLASPLFELGPPKEPAIELARIVDRGVRESGTIDTKTLCIEPGKAVYTIFADVYPLEYDGNLIDASSLAVNAALRITKFAERKVEDGKVVLTGKIIPAPLQNMAIEITIAKIGSHMLVDLTLKEEMVQESRLTIAVDKDNKLTAMQKGGGHGPMSLDEIDRAMGIALDRSADMRKMIEDAEKAFE
ncbi:MAG: exosome complex protein Rrp42 [Candidatus Thorarchaeota archaeon]